MILRLPACCCTLAVLLAGVLPLAAVASVNITHQCDNKFFQYEEDHPVDGNVWTYDIPSKYIPGGISPISNAITHLTAETRLAFTGAFDAYFRRLMASVCFGTADCTNIAVGNISEYRELIEVETGDDWRSDNVITNIFHNHTNFWYLATNRVYIVTNMEVTVSNWVGYATNVVYVSGKPRVKIENRYDVSTSNVVDTARILYRYHYDHDAMRVKIDNPIHDMMVSTGVDDFMLPIPEPWPDREGFLIGLNNSTTISNEPVSIRREDFLGWTFSDVASEHLTPSAEWQPSLLQLFTNAMSRTEGGFAGYFPTTWDLFGAQNSREAIARDVRDDAGIKYLEYPSVCPDDWEAFCQYMTGGGITDGLYAMTNLVGITFTTNVVVDIDIGTNTVVVTNNWQTFLPSTPLINPAPIVLTNIVVTGSVVSVTNVVETNIVTTVTNDVTVVETNIVETTSYSTNTVVYTNSHWTVSDVTNHFPNSNRIIWSDWAGTDAYLALCDTSIAGNRAMPRLRYEIESTGGVAVVNYRGKAGGGSLGIRTYIDPVWGTFSRVYTLTNDTFELVRDGDATIENGYGAHEILEERVELAYFDVGNGVTLVVYGKAAPEDTGDPQVGVNYYQEPMSEVKNWLRQYCDDMQYQPNDLDTFSITIFDGNPWEMPYFAISGGGGTDYAARPYYGDYMIEIRATNVTCAVSMQVDQSTTLKVMPYDYSLAVVSNSIPCLYPNPVYIEPSHGVDEIADIYPTAISAIGITTNVMGGSTYFVPDTNGYLFAMHSGSHHPLDGPKKVDDFWLDQDDLLAEKMGEEVAHRAGANPRAPGGVLEAFAATFDQLLAGEDNTFFADMLGEKLSETVEGDGRITFSSTWSPEIFQVDNVRPSSDPGYLWDFDVKALEWNEQTMSYEPMSPQPLYFRHEWRMSMLEDIHTNLDLNISQAAARGRLSGIEAVKWNFKAMRDARNSNP